METIKSLSNIFRTVFRETGLPGCLKENEITDLVICGMTTHMCITTEKYLISV